MLSVLSVVGVHRQSIRNSPNARRNLGVKKKPKGKQQLLGDVYLFLRGETGQAVLKAKVHFIEDAEMNDAEIPAKPAYVPVEGSLGIAPAINTSAVWLATLLREWLLFNSSNWKGTTANYLTGSGFRRPLKGGPPCR